MKIPFTKMHGLGNDFILVNSFFKEHPHFLPEVKSTPILKVKAELLCNRQFGIGADQILHLIQPEDPVNHVRMAILNQDGSLAEMCGNGIRAVALFLKKDVGIKDALLRIETLGGVKKVESLDVQGGDFFKVDMGVPGLGKEFWNQGEVLSVEGFQGRFFEVNMGNPHAVFFVNQKVKDFDLDRIGRMIENHSRFPQRTNVEFVEILNENEVNLRVWERGSGATLACGTGACATGVALIGNKKTNSPVQVNLPGGTLKIEWKVSGVGSEPVFMTGPAVKVFEGVFL